jgi:hypothetical protein
MTNSERNASGFTIETGSLPGLRLLITSVFQFASLGEEKTPDNPAGGPGEYRATLVLHRPGHPLEPHLTANASDLLQGDSYLKLKSIIQINANITDNLNQLTSLTMNIRTNDRGFLAKIETQAFQAQNFNEARQLAFRMVAPQLSFWSIECNIPMSIYRIDLIEVATESRQIDCVLPFPEIDLIPPSTPMSAKFRGYASLYRESVNSNTPAYSVLCLYRILEGLFNDRKQRGQEAGKKGHAKPSYPTWHVPATKQQFVSWLNALYRVRFNWDANLIEFLFPKEARGKKITKVKDDFLEPLRNRIAHSIFGDTGSEPWEESIEHFEDVNNWLPLTQIIVRRILKNEFPNEFLVGVPDDDLVEKARVSKKD